MKNQRVGALEKITVALVKLGDARKGVSALVLVLPREHKEGISALIVALTREHVKRQGTKSSGPVELAGVGAMT